MDFCIIEPYLKFYSHVISCYIAELWHLHVLDGEFIIRFDIRNYHEVARNNWTYLILYIISLSGTNHVSAHPTEIMAQTAHLSTL